MRRLALVVAVTVGVVAAAGFWMAPPPGRTLAPHAELNVRGVFHVHTTRSDGTGSVEEVAAAAARAGLSFVIFTDHGDATRRPDPPAYRSGVLCIDAVEISTDGGHVAALGLGHAPYPIGGEPRDVVDDIRRLGGVSIVTHPGSPKPGLRWIEWTAPFDGLEWLNGDSEWRDEGRGTLARAALTFPIRPIGTLTSVLDRPAPVIARWDALTQRRRVVALVGTDAHAHLWSPDDRATSARWPVLPFPSYEQVFRAMSIAIPGLSLTRNAATDAEAVIRAIREGQVYSSIDGLAAPAALTFTASTHEIRGPMGGPLEAGQPIAFEVETNAPGDARTILLRDGAVLASADGGALRHVEPGQPGVYRVEVHLSGAPGDPPVPWIVSNPIYVQPEGATQAAPDPRGPATEFFAVYEDGSAVDATVERSPRSQGALDVAPEVGGTQQLSLRYALGGILSESPYVALVMPAGPALSGYDRLLFTARSAAPMRVSVQLRVPEGVAGERWHRSVYLDETAREISIPFDEMTPRGPTTRRRPVLQMVRDLLFVVDTVNTKPGASGWIWIDDIKYGR
jgi:hypothetical protein